ncbi:MAG: histidine kinase, partial [Burkholderiales bacterium PBB5]
MKLPKNRRLRDRRQGERRGPPRSGDSAWWGAWGDPASSRFGARADDASPFDTDPEGNSDSRFIAREALRLVSSEGAALPRILRTYTAARAALSLALVLAPWLASLTGGKPAMLMVLVCLAYAGQAISLWLLSGADDDRPPPEHLLPRQWLWTIGVDLVAFSMLRLLDPAGQLNYTALLVLPVLMSGVLTRRLVA